MTTTNEYFINDLRNVGPQKPLGYLPLTTIEADCGLRVDQVVTEMADKGLVTRTFKAGACNIESGALYVYHPAALKSVLHQHRKVLQEAGWPTDADGFVIAVATRIARPETVLYDAVADAFADHNNPNRNDRKFKG